MGMREYPTSGYLVPIEKFVSLLSQSDQEKLEELIEDGDTFEIEDFLNQFSGHLFPRVDSVYSPSDTDTFDVPEDPLYASESNIYVVYDQESLYETLPKKALIDLMAKGVKPWPSSWSVWC